MQISSKHRYPAGGVSRTNTSAEFFVSTDGNDGWSGRRPRHSRAGSDGPFATLARARDAVRELKQRQGGRLASPVTVWVLGGCYHLEQPLALTAEDSGTAEAPVVYRAWPGAEVRLIGGRQVQGFARVSDPAVLGRLDRKARNRVWQANLRDMGIGDFGQPCGGFGLKEQGPGIELFFGDRRMQVARWPNEGFARIGGLLGLDPVSAHGLGGDKVGKFIYEGDRPGRWAGEKEGWVHGYWFFDWADQRHRIESVDAANRTLAVSPPYHIYGYRKGQWFYAYNLLSELDAPGEWFLDRASGMLYFWPPSAIRGGRPTVSVLPSLVTMDGAAFVTLAGLTLEVVRGDAVTVGGGDHCRIVGCTIRNVGGVAVNIAGGREHAVIGCDITETGGGGIIMSGGDRLKLKPAGHVAENNHICRYGRWTRMYQAGIRLGGVGLRVAHNLIHDAPHIGVLFSGNEHRIEFNEIHHVCEEANDAGAIYSGRDWTMRGTIIRHNYLHDLTGFEGRGCAGVYLDDCFSGTRIYGNVFSNASMAVLLGGGRDNVVENNIFSDCLPALHVDARGKGWAKSWFTGQDSTLFDGLKAVHPEQPPYSVRYPRLKEIPGDDPAAPKGTEILRNICVGGRWLAMDDHARPHVHFDGNLVGPGMEKDLVGTGDVEIPCTWQVFGPWEINLENVSEPPLRTEDLSRMPPEVVVGGRTFPPRNLDLRGHVLDFETLCGGWNPDDWRAERCRTAMAFAEIMAEREGDVSMGAGADWLMRVWVNGSLECDTTRGGNRGFPPRITDHRFSARLRKGRNVVAVQVVGGKSSFQLAIGGPREFREAQQAATENAVDPLFVDLAAGDFHLRDESPAYALGFRDIPRERIGLYQDERRASWPPA
ncbi:MAG: right-handed parallel beta-helix repeat-containing protein [Kiritimatiellae bacterium]|nr:right-handed parallel beta-helix repeat-containing protein [Kiritimatiellia bacterium]